jgi:predicted transcriptional regulator
MTANASEAPEDLSARRRRLGLSQQQLATAAECSLSTVRLFESGYAPRRSPTRKRVERVLEALAPTDTRGALAADSLTCADPVSASQPERA